MSLTTQEMIVATETFQESFRHVMGNYPVPEAKQYLLKFVLGVIMVEKPYMLVTDEGIQRAIALVFTAEAERDFILTLTYTFFSRFGETSAPAKNLAAALARGIALTGVTTSQLSAAPDAIKTRLPTEEEARAILEANQWLMTVLLIQLCVQITDDAKKQAV